MTKVGEVEEVITSSRQDEQMIGTEQTGFGLSKIYYK